jgi:hypothetical protein
VEKKLPTLRTECAAMSDNEYDSFVHDVRDIPLAVVLVTHQPCFSYQLGAEYGASRSSDTSKLRLNILSYVSKSTISGSLDPPISPEGPKAGVRGFHHRSIAELLTPWDDLREFQADPDR